MGLCHCPHRGFLKKIGGFNYDYNNFNNYSYTYSNNSLLEYKYDNCILVCVQCTLFTLFIFGFISALVLFISYNTDADAKKEALIIEQSMLNKQVDEHWYNNLTENGKRDLIDRIEEYNKNLAYNKKLSHNKYIGILIPDIYDDINYINIS